MKKGFTLLELIIVIIILGVLATLGFTQYARMVERARGAEAKAICGDIRKFAAAYRLENGTLTAGTGFGAAQANIGASSDQIPATGACRASHYFGYGVAVTASQVTITATRCTASGKTPNYTGTGAPTLILTSELLTGVDGWSGTGNY